MILARETGYDVPSQCFNAFLTRGDWPVHLPRNLRRNARLTLFDVAQRSGLSMRVIAEIEHGLRPLGEVERICLARALEVTPCDLLARPPFAAAPATRPLRRWLPQLGRAVLLSALLGKLGGSSVAAASRTEPAASAAVLVQPTRPAALTAPAPAPAPRRRSDTPRLVRSPDPEAEPPEALLAPPLHLTPVPPLPYRPKPASADPAKLAPPPPPPPPEPAPEPAPVTLSLHAAPAPAAMGGASLPLPPDGPFRQNVVAALGANGGALQSVVIPPGSVWSFNQAIGDPGRLDLAEINGVRGGGWCDLASRYVVALRPLLPPEALEFAGHVEATGSGLYGVADADAVVIWNANGNGGDRDLRVHNTTAQTLIISAWLTDGGVELSAGLE